VEMHLLATIELMGYYITDGIYAAIYVLSFDQFV
jgi:hypothetical protein